MLKYPNLKLTLAQWFLITRRWHVLEARVLFRVYDLSLHICAPVYLIAYVLHRSSLHLYFKPLAAFAGLLFAGLSNAAFVLGGPLVLIRI